MKPTLKIVAMLLFIGLASSAKAGSTDGAPKPSKPNLNVLNNVITMYVNCIVNGKVDYMESIIRDDASFTTTGTGKTHQFGKTEALKEYQFNKGVVQQDCTTSFVILEQSGPFAMIKVVMNYPTFSKENYVSMGNDGEGWKITNIHSVFK